jgi:hypothetical protein
MKVFQISSDVNYYLWLMPDVTDSEILQYTTFNCTKRLGIWTAPSISIYEKSALEGDFAYYTPGALVASPRSIRSITPFFENAGELLPFWCEGDEYTLLNVTTCGDALDHEKTEWYRAGDGSKVSIKKYSFREDQLAMLRSSIFKIPETCEGSVLTWEENGNPETEFKAFVEVNGLTGLLFEELWDSGKD